MRDDAAHMLFRRGLDPNRKAAREELVIGFGLGDDAAASRQHKFRMAVEHTVQGTALGPPVSGLAGQGENLAERQPEIPLDLGVKLDERHVEMTRQTAAQRRFAGAAQPDQRYAPLPRLKVGRGEMRVEQRPRLAEPVLRQAAQKLDDPPQFGRFGRLTAEQPGKRQVERVADPAQQFDREIAFSAFELGKITLRQTGIALTDIRRVMPRRARSSRTRSPRRQR